MAEDVARIWGPFLDYLKKMEVALKCSVCSNMLEKPTLLPCNHMFCSDCVDRLTRKDSVCPCCKLSFLHKDSISALHIEKIVSLFNEMDAAIGDIIQQSLTYVPDKQEETHISLSSRENQDSNFCTYLQGAEHVSKNKEQSNKPSLKAFACGACGQLGHIRTNKSCPKYGEDLETPEMESVSDKSNFSDGSQLEFKSPRKNGKYPPMKLECDSADKAYEKRLHGNQTSDQDNAHAGTKVKAAGKTKGITISNKMQFEDVQPELYQPSTVSWLQDEEPRKKIIMKRPKLSTVLEPERQIFGTEVDGWSSKEKNIDKLSSLKKPKCQESVWFTEEKTKRNFANSWSLSKEEKERRGKERIAEERNKMTSEDEQNLNELWQRLSGARDYDEPIGKEELKMTKRKKEGKKKANSIDFYVSEHSPLRNDREVPKLVRAAKRRHVDSRQSNYEPTGKYNRPGKAELSNILQSILKILRNSEMAHPFHKPVTKREAPEYLDIIKWPMDLSTIRDKVSNMEYQCREDFRHDVFQITYNAHVYYDRRKPGIAASADGLLELCDHYLEKRHEELSHVEDAIKLKGV